jgi:hypothetical protein
MTTDSEFNPFERKNLLPKIDSYAEGGKERQDIHLAFLFASPLVFEEKNGQFNDNIGPISFHNEFK